MPENGLVARRARVKIPLAAPFQDARGSIQPLIDEAIHSCVLITSKAGSIRANHYHKEDWHYCYVLRGQIEYHYRTCGDESTPAIQTFSAGDMFFTPDNVEHAMKFLADTEFLAFGGQSRQQACYEDDLVRVQLISS